jgi:hypothetical protein
MVLRLEKMLMREYHSMSAPVDSTPSNITRRRHASTAGIWGVLAKCQGSRWKEIWTDIQL